MLFVYFELSFFCFSEYAKLNPQLFSKYIPNIFPPSTVLDLDKYVEETRQLQREIQNLPEFHWLVKYTCPAYRFQASYQTNCMELFICSSICSSTDLGGFSAIVALVITYLCFLEIIWNIRLPEIKFL